MTAYCHYAYGTLPGRNAPLSTTCLPLICAKNHRNRLKITTIALLKNAAKSKYFLQNKYVNPKLRLRFCCYEPLLNFKAFATASQALTWYSWNIWRQTESVVVLPNSNTLSYGG